MNTHNKFACLGMFLLHLQGCALIMGKPVQSFTINSQPDNALVSIVDEGGTEVFSGKTPAKLSLTKSTGKYYGSKTYLIHISKQGYQTQIFPVASVPNNYYLYGNLVTAYIGWFLVDPFFPNMYDLAPESIDTTLEQQKNKP